jgi:hypothetical protein
MLMSAQYSMLELMICEPTDSAISSLALADGATLFDLPAGQTTEKSGQVHARVSRSASPAKAKVNPTSATFGLFSSTSSDKQDPLSSWVNRLRERLDTIGSTELPLTWKEKITPQGQSIFRLAPSMRRTFASASIGAPWATPTLCGNYNRKGLSASSGDGLATQVAATWSTPTVQDSENTAGPSQFKRNSQALNVQAVTHTTWPTPTANQFEGGCPQKLLERREMMKAKHGNGNGFGLTLGQTATITGVSMNGSPAQTEKRGALNPEFVCWLMGFPTEWDACGVTVTPLSRRSRQK